MNNPEEIIIHCAGTPVGVPFTHKDVYKWHVKENGWSNVGYHFVIELDGKITPYRRLHEVGAHCADNSMNDESIGICLMGGYKGKNKSKKWDRCTPEQEESLIKIKMSLELILGKKLPVNPHSLYNKGKSCPNFDINKLGL